MATAYVLLVDRKANGTAPVTGTNVLAIYLTADDAVQGYTTNVVEGTELESDKVAIRAGRPVWFTSNSGEDVVMVRAKVVRDDGENPANPEGGRRKRKTTRRRRNV